MTLHPDQFSELKPYLLYDRKLASSKHNIGVYQSRFGIMARYFAKREFTRVHFVGFMGYLTEKGYSNNYINNFIKLAKHVDKFYKLNELQDFTYFDKPRSNPDYLTGTQIQDMADVTYPYRREAQFKNTRNRILIMTMFLTGARISEILDLTWDDLKDGTWPFLRFNQKKVNDLRYNPIPRDLYSLLVTLPHFGGYIFSDSKGHQITDESVADDLKRRARAIGIEKRVYNHLIRHSFTKFMLKDGAKIEDVSKLLGHKRIETTYQYYFDVLLEELGQTLESHHPHFKKDQTLEFLHEKARTFFGKLMNLEKFSLRSRQEDGKIHLEIHELNHD